MDDNLNVKLTDFGFATEIEDDEELYGERHLVLHVYTTNIDCIT